MKKFKSLLFGAIGILGILGITNAGSYQVVSETYSTGCNDCSVSASTYNADIVCIVNDTCSTRSFGYNFDHGDWGGQMGQIPVEHLGNGLGVCGKDTIYYTINTNCNYIVNYLTIDLFDLNIIQNGNTYTYNINTGININLSNNVEFDTTNYPNIGITAETITTGGECQGLSELYINDVRMESMPFLNIYIPEEIQRTYNYTGNATQLDIEVEGYTYDQEKMQNMVNTQYYKPTADEMSELVGKVADFLPLIAVALLIIWIGRILKKVFKK